MTDAPAGTEALRARLDASRAVLLAALEGITEREFAADLGGGLSVVRALAELAAAERAEVARAGGAAGEVRVPDKPLAPQVVHDLAGARYQTVRLLAAGVAAPAALDALVAGIADREAAMAERIEALKRAR